MSHVFISYTKQNADYAYRLADFLEQVGFAIWIDRSDIGYGMKWWKAIEQGITDCVAMIILMSPEAEESEWVQKEVFWGMKLKKPHLPILLSGECWSLLYDLQFFDATGKAMPDLKFLNRLSTYITPRAGASTVTKPTESTFKLQHSIDILPQPFDWITIPAGKVTLEDTIPEDEEIDYGYLMKSSRVYNVSTFQITKYPITYAQYKVFVDADDGYQNDEWWNFLIQAQNSHRNVSFYMTRFKENNMPCTKVTWYDAVAFCLWLSFKTKENINLPSEQQWQRAAQGDNMYIYPWGNDWDKTRCHNHLNSSGSPAIVTQYITGINSYGLMHMAGNVWEWCLTDWDTGSVDINYDSYRVVKGGSWRSDDTEEFQCNYRRKEDPSFSYLDLGFRIVRSSQS